MSKINNNLIAGALILLGILTIGIIFALPNNASAEYKFIGGGGGYTYYDDGNYGGSGGGYSIEDEGLSPIIYSITPDTLTTGGGPRTITINGRDFAPGAVAKIGSFVRPTTYVNSGRLTMQLGSADLAKTGEYLITVRNPNGETSNAMLLNIRPKGSVFGSTDNANTSGNTTSSTTYTSKSNLSANASGGASFMPRTLLGWLMLFIVILLAVVLWRKLYVTEEDKHKPLKHA